MQASPRDLLVLPPLSGPPPHRPPGAVSMLLGEGQRLLGSEPGGVALLNRHASQIELREACLHLPQQPGALERAVRAAFAGPPEARVGLALQGGPAAHPLTLQLHRQDGGAAVWLHVVDGARMTLDAEVLGSMFGLTVAERRVALLLADGFSADEIGAQLCVQANTTRGHIKQLLAKTHTRRQAELIALLWRSAAVHWRDETQHPPVPGVRPSATAAPYPNGQGQLA